MPYVENRIVHDADSHLMELADCLDDFDESLRGRSQAEIDGFYCDNFIDLMDEGLAAELRKPKLRVAA